MSSYHSFAAIVYVTKTEKQAVMRMFDWREFSVDGDDQAYMDAYVDRDGKRLRVVCAQQDEMGMTASSVLTMKMISHFAPEYVIMPGIAAGTGGIPGTVDQDYGDVLLATSVWNYSNGKYVSPQEAEIVFGDVGFNPRPAIVEISGAHLQRIREYLRSNDNQFFVHSGPLASGTAVVANETILRKQVMARFRETAGIEMEGYGVAYAASHAIGPKPSVIIAKSICDFADRQKDDAFQKFAAFTSCSFVVELLKNVLDYDGDYA